MSHLLALPPMIFADAPPCVAAKHNPCSYAPAASMIPVLVVLAVVVLATSFMLARIASRRKKRERV